MRKLLKRDEGFTLIELMVVVLIIGILVAIALPTFLGARNRANDKAAQSSLRNGLVAAKTCFTDGDTYVGCDNTKVGGIETSITFVGNAVDSTGPTQISVAVPTATSWWAASLSKSGTCYYIQDFVTTTGTSYSKLAAGAAACAGDDADGATYTATGWQ